MPSSTIYAVLLALVIGVGCGEKAVENESNEISGNSMPVKTENSQTCYWCKELIKSEAIICKFCGKTPEGPILDKDIENAARKELKNPAGELTSQDYAEVVRLNLSDTNISDESLKELEKFKNLSVLNLGNTKITDAGIPSLVKLKNLSTLKLHRTMVTDLGLVKVAELKSLSTLWLFRTKTTNQGLKEISKLKNLKTLDLADTDITDLGLSELISIKSLTGLYLYDTQITDSGVQYLSKMKSLKNLILKGSKITVGGWTDLQIALPNCSVSHNAKK